MIVMKFNEKARGKSRYAKHPTATLNKEGGLAFSLSPKAELTQLVASCFVNEQRFYDSSGSDSIDRIAQLVDIVAEEDPEYVVQLAVYARHVLYLRSVSEYLIVLASRHLKARKFVRKYVPHVLTRADQPTEALACLIGIEGHVGRLGDGKLAKSLQRGIADALHNFNEYDLGKYLKADAEVKLSDVIKLTHPKAWGNEKKAALWKKVLENKLESPDTWEVITAQEGSNTESWTKAAKVMPYFATLRNLRNLLQHKVEMTGVLDRLTKRDAVLNNKLFPFRYYSAYSSIEDIQSEYTSATLDAIETAMDISVENLPVLPGKTLIAADNSGSMDHQISDKSTVTARDIANMLLSMGHKMCEVPLTVVFATDCKQVNIPKRNGVISGMKAAQEVAGRVGEATYGYKVIKLLVDNKIKVDRIVLLTDEQLYNQSGGHAYWGTPADHKDDRGKSFQQWLAEYRQIVNPDCRLYSINLVGYGHTLMPEGDSKSLLVQGWSDKILSYIPQFEQDAKTVVQRIKEGIKPDKEAIKAFVKSHSSGENDVITAEQ